MNREVYRNEHFCAVAEDGRLVEYIPEDPSENAGEVVLGRVDRISAGMKAAFVDIGRERSGYLPLSEGSKSFQGSPLKSGDAVIVQIKKEEIGEKGAFLTRDITLPGSNVIVMPMNRFVGISRHVVNEESGERLRELGNRVSGGRFGLIMRAAAETAEETEIRTETESLRQVWDGIARAALAGRAPMSLWKGTGAFQDIMDGYAARGGVARVLQDQPLTADLERQLRTADQRRVELPHGGNIVIDRCEAMTVIDVNSAGAGGTQPGIVFLQTNLDACGEIVRQVRLRNLSGMILIDLINMDSEKDRSLVLNTLQKAFENDRIKTVIHGYTTLGIMEITRKRTRPDRMEQQTDCCPVCGGSGRIPKRREHS